jgi:hypothetical protein
MTAYPASGGIAERIAHLRQSVPASVRVIAVTKQVPVAAMRLAYAAGVRDFGESRIQEAEEKQEALRDLADVVWHFIGHLQANKAQKALQLFQWIHSVDNLKLAQRLNRLAEPLGNKPNICLQVKILPDPNKYGWSLPELMHDLAQLNQLQHLNIRGLMMIPPLGLTDAELLDLFQQTCQLARTIQDQHWSHIKIEELSMGMSNDYPLAVQAGATMIRPGRILFGDRP